MDKIEKYIQEHRAQGYSDSQIKSALNRGGWADEHFAHLLEKLPHPLDIESATPESAQPKTWSLMSVGALASAKLILLAVAFVGFSALTSSEDGQTLGQTTTPNVDFSQEAKDARDAEREKDLQGLLALVQTSAATGSLPADVAELEDLVSNSASRELREPILDRIYVFTFREPALGQFQYVPGQNCDGEALEDPSAFFVATRLESQRVICFEST